MHMLEANLPCASGNLFLNITKTSFEEWQTLVLVIYGQLQLNLVCWTMLDFLSPLWTLQIGITFDH